jgi:hypothetical protein
LARFVFQFFWFGFDSVFSIQTYKTKPVDFFKILINFSSCFGFFNYLIFFSPLLKPTKTVYHGAKPHAWHIMIIFPALSLLNPKYFLLFSDDDENGKIL